VLIGDNGSGKSTVLQAIALTLSLADCRTRDLMSFNWHGFVPERVPSLGPTFVEIQVAFEPEEIQLTQELFFAWRDSLPPERRQTMNIVPPSDRRKVTLRFEDGRVRSPEGFEAVTQFLGRYYIKSLRGMRPELKEQFAKLGDVFWFDQHRNLGSLLAGEMNSESLVFGESDRTADSRGLARGRRSTSRVSRWLVGLSYHAGAPREGFHSAIGRSDGGGFSRHKIHRYHAARRDYLASGQ
jgi:energy-coupling factor transporter ATP-binding protein EcfA2